MARLLTFLLLPLAWLYAAVLAGRNWLYDHGWQRSETFAVPLVGVGNLRVGGTGKTPHVLWLVEELLRQGHRP
ncbi:tetraacyldisaccharide 4'-kinase, partial [Hymenobacter agri]